MGSVDVHTLHAASTSSILGLCLPPWKLIVCTPPKVLHARPLPLPLPCIRWQLDVVHRRVGPWVRWARAYYL